MGLDVVAWGRRQLTSATDELRCEASRCHPPTLAGRRVRNAARATRSGSHSSAKRPAIHATAASAVTMSGDPSAAPLLAPSGSHRKGFNRYLVWIPSNHFARTSDIKYPCCTEFSPSAYHI